MSFNKWNNVSTHMCSPLIVLEDFNCVARMDEQISHEARFQETTHLWNCMFNCRVLEIKFSGRFFTWTNKRVWKGRVMCKLDRVLGNQE